MISLRYPRETGFDEQRLVEQAGMRYHNVPFGRPASLSADKLDLARRLLREAPRPLLLHCASADRVGAAWLAYRVMDTGATWDHTMSEARTVGLRTSEYIHAVENYTDR